MRIKSVISCIGLILALYGGFIAVQPAFAAPTLVVAVESPPKSMNPHSENGDATLGVMTNIFDGLMQRQKTDGKLIPALAEKVRAPGSADLEVLPAQGRQIPQRQPLHRRRRQVHV